MDKIKKVFNFEVRQIGEDGDRTLEMTGSTESQDRDGDEIDVMGWELSDYLNNPVIMGFHEYDKFPYASSTKTYIDMQSKKLKFLVKFPTIAELTSYPDSPEMIAEHAKNVDLAFNMYKNGYMRAVSVGFIGKEWEPLKDGGRRYLKQSLLELSLVPVPSNPTALIDARSKGLISDDEMKRFEEPYETELKEVELLIDTEAKEVFILDEGKKAFRVKVASEFFEQKSGATISAKNREILNAVHSSMDDCTMKLKTFIDSTMPMDPDDMPMMSAQMTMPMMDPMMEPMMSAMRTAIASEIKGALDVLTAQVLSLIPKLPGSSEDINLDEIQYTPPAKVAALDELDIEPDAFKSLVTQLFKEQIKNIGGGI